ncbi:2434_t:CDS:1, partial [Racocetra persica]
MLQNLYNVSKTSRLQYFRTSRYMLTIFNRNYVTQPQVTRDLQNLNHVEIDGEGLTIENVIQVSRFHREARLTTNNAIRDKITSSNNYVNNAIAEGKIIYGVNTNFGGMAKKHLPIEELNLLQKNLIWGCKCSVGKQLPVEHVRASMLIRANALMRGVSGIRLELIERLIKFLNADLIPVVREYGSVGASGDVVPLTNIAGVIIGLDSSFKVNYLGSEIDALSALSKLELKPITLGPKEGLALINGTSFSTGIAAQCIYEVDRLFSLALHLHSFFVQALQGSSLPFDHFIHKHKPHEGQIRVASEMTELIHGSKFLDDNISTMKGGVPKLVQDRYSLRGIPQYLGVVVDTFTQAKKYIETEINSASDNPLIDADQQKYFHQANFIGQYIAYAMDQVRHGLGLIAKHIDTQIA